VTDINLLSPAPAANDLSGPVPDATENTPGAQEFSYEHEIAQDEVPY
jgi:hypothetical protein